MGQRVSLKHNYLQLHDLTAVICFSNLEGVGGGSTINPAICPTGFVKFIDVCILEVDNAPADFSSIHLLPLQYVLIIQLFY